ncbi:MAG: hypothetical protein Q9217_005496 [Psora testacea]
MDDKTTTPTTIPTTSSGVGSAAPKPALNHMTKTKLKPKNRKPNKTTRTRITGRDGVPVLHGKCGRCHEWVVIRGKVRPGVALGEGLGLGLVYGRKPPDGVLAFTNLWFKHASECEKPEGAAIRGGKVVFLPPKNSKKNKEEGKDEGKEGEKEKEKEVVEVEGGKEVEIYGVGGEVEGDSASSSKLAD